MESHTIVVNDNVITYNKYNSFKIYIYGQQTCITGLGYGGQFYMLRVLGMIPMSKLDSVLTTLMQSHRRRWRHSYHGTSNFGKNFYRFYEVSD